MTIIPLTMAILLILMYAGINIKEALDSTTGDKRRLIERARKLVMPAQYAHTTSHARTRSLQIAYATIDVEGLGVIDTKELLLALQEVDDSEEGGDAVEKVRKMFEEVDVNGDGEIDFEEFVNAM